MASRQRQRKGMDSSDSLTEADESLAALCALVGERCTLPDAARALGYRPAEEVSKRLGHTIGGAKSALLDLFKTGKLERLKVLQPDGNNHQKPYWYRVKRA
jgi:hypothetical protein